MIILNPQSNQEKVHKLVHLPCHLALLITFQWMNNITPGSSVYFNFTNEDSLSFLPFLILIFG